MTDVTRLLQSIDSGDPSAAAELLPLVYEELRRLATYKMANEPPGQTLQPTALVHDAWLRLTRSEQVKWNGRAHFFAAAAEAMRRILIDNARRKRALRHGGGQQRVDIQEIDVPAETKDDELLAVNEALDRLATADAQKADLVKLRYFVGMTIEEAGEALGISPATAKRYWTFARAWLYQEVNGTRSG